MSSELPSWRGFTVLTTSRSSRLLRREDLQRRRLPPVVEGPEGVQQEANHFHMNGWLVDAGAYAVRLRAGTMLNSPSKGHSGRSTVEVDHLEWRAIGLRNEKGFRNGIPCGLMENRVVPL